VAGAARGPFGAGMIAPTGAFELRQFDRDEGSFRCGSKQDCPAPIAPVLPTDLNEKM